MITASRDFGLEYQDKINFLFHSSSKGSVCLSHIQLAWAHCTSSELGAMSLGTPLGTQAVLGSLRDINIITSDAA